MKKYKIMILTTIGGFVSQFEMENVRLMNWLGMEVHYASNFDNPVYTLKKQELEEHMVTLHHVDIDKSPFHVRTNRRAFKELVRIVEEEQIDCIHCHNPVGGVLGRLLGRYFRKSGLKVIYTVHGMHFYKGAPFINWLFYYPVERILARYTDYLITINTEDCMRAKTFSIKEGGQVLKIPGVGINRMRLRIDSNDRIQYRQRWKIPQDAFHIMSIGEVNRNKNHQVVIRAMKKLNRQDIYYTICGEGAEEESLKKLIKDSNLEGNVFLRGYTEQIGEVLAGGDCFVFPSVREGLGMAALEAMTTGLPVIALKNRGSLEYLEHGRNGLFVNENRAEAFAGAIEWMYEHRKECRQMGKEAVLTAKKFDKERTTAIMSQVYTRLKEG